MQLLYNNSLCLNQRTFNMKIENVAVVNKIVQIQFEPSTLTTDCVS